MLDVDLSYTVFMTLKYIAHYTKFVESFYHDRMLILSNAFSASIEMII